MTKLEYNGIPIILHKMGTDIVHLRIIVNVGSMYENPEEYGVAHFLEHMAFQGTEKHTSNETYDILSSLGQHNASTGQQWTEYYITTTKDKINQAIGMLFEIVFTQKLMPENINKERGVIAEEEQSGLDSPDHYSTNKAFEHYLGSKIGHSIVGTKETIKNMGRETLLNFRNKHYFNKSNILSVVSGDIENEDVIKELSKTIDNVPFNKTSVPNFCVIGDSKEVPNEEDYYYTHKGQQAIIRLMAKTYGETNSIKNKWINNFYTYYLASDTFSLMFKKVRNEMGLCYSIHGGNYKFEDQGIMSFVCHLSKENIDKAKDAMLTIMKEASQKIDEEIFNIAKSRMLFNLCNGNQTATDYADTLVERYFLTGGIIYEPKYIKDVLTSITIGDLQAYAWKVMQGKIKYVQMTQGE